ncbi:hypothetical protein PV327_008204 [Microctonus hyperodae]|uniref:Uncharacterized protein n=1 Tax=Microctonus hyperodae TaxID=165561 RepID=A0AA39F2L6_MICHY|nr:hypothetical protein PV327_008204 [Microctonus hyperodae]
MNSVHITTDFTKQIQQLSENEQRKIDRRMRKYKKSIEGQGQFCLNTFKCKSCHYTSSRQYNVLRHEERIHIRKLERSCCGKKFGTKGEWYLHCEEKHPKLRATAFISKEKYKIVKHFNESVERGDINIVRRRSKRIQESIKNQQSVMFNEFDDESIDDMNLDDIPLIYFVENEKLREKFIEKLHESRHAFKDEEKITTSCISESNNSVDDCNDVLQVTNNDGDNCVKDKSIYNRKIVVIKTQTFEVMNIKHDNSDVNNNCDNENNFLEINQRACNLKFSYSNESKISTNINIPFHLPIKKRILQELKNNSPDKNRQRRYKEKSKNDDKTLMLNDKENIEPTLKNYFDSGSMKKKVLVTRAQESFTWNQITQYQRAYLSSIDFDHFKIY